MNDGGDFLVTLSAGYIRIIHSTILFKNNDSSRNEMWPSLRASYWIIPQTIC